MTVKTQIPEHRMHQSHIRKDSSQIIINIITYILVTIFCIMCILPFWMIIASSFATEDSIRRSGFTLWPTESTTFSYELLFRSPDQMIGAYLVTIGLTAVGTLIGLFLVAMTGYALQRKDFPYRNKIMFYIYFTSLFSAGLVPFYLLIVQYLNLRDSYFAILLPLLMSPWLIVLMKNFVKAIPHEITESGKIDGAGDMTVFVYLILPMIKPALATIGLFLALGYWNEWYQSSLFLTARVTVKPLQYTLYEIVNKLDALRNSVAGQYITLTDIPEQSVKMANAVLATGPIVLLYPFVQKYFIGGITVGAVKG